MLCLQRETPSGHSKKNIFNGFCPNFTCSTENFCTLIGSMCRSYDESKSSFSMPQFDSYTPSEERSNRIRLFNCLVGEFNNAVDNFKSHQLSSVGAELLKSSQFYQNHPILLEKFVQKFQCNYNQSALVCNIDLSPYCCFNTSPVSKISVCDPSTKVSSTVMLKSQFPSMSSATVSSSAVVVSISTDSVSNNHKTSVYVDLQSVSKSTKKETMNAMDKELINRKSRKINKRSKKKRRRKKKGGIPHNEVLSYPNDTSSKCDKEINDCKNKNVSHTTSGADAEIKYCENEVIFNFECPNSHISFILGQNSESASEDDWDYDENDWNYAATSIPDEDLDFGFPSLLLTGGINSLCISNPTSAIQSCQISVIEVTEMTPELRRVNEKWHMVTSDIQSTEKLPSKVCFSEVALVTICPVDIYDRKGEWELFARERCHFKRRIQEVEKVLTPFLSVSHREKVYQQLTSKYDS